jgi:hypothetical protein
MHNTVGSNINVLKRISKETAKAIGTGKQLFSHDTAWVSGKVELSDNDSLSTCSTSSWIALIVVLLESVQDHPVVLRAVSDPDGGILGLRVHIIPYSRQLTRAMSD